MKTKTVEKILGRYIKGLRLYEQQAVSNNCKEDAQMYMLDRIAMEAALAAVQKTRKE